MMTKHLEGNGQVFVDGEYFTDVYYELEEFRDTQGFGGIAGYIEAENPQLIFVLLNQDGITTLHLSDGRQLEFSVENADPTSKYGYIKGLGAIRDAT